MHVSQVVTGLGLAAFGVGFYVASYRYVNDNALMRRMAESRWPLDRWLVRKVRNGKMSKEEWFALFIRRQRVMVRWLFVPVWILWLYGCLMMVISGLRG